MYETNLLYYLAQQQPGAGGTTTQTAPSKTPNGTPAKPKAGGGSFLTTGLMFAAVFIGMYFLVIRPQRKEEKRKKELLSKLDKGDKVVTTSGLIGTVSSVKDETVIINVGDGTRLEFLRSAVNEVRTENRAPTGKK